MDNNVYWRTHKVTIRNKAEALREARLDGWVLPHLSLELQDDKEVVLACMEQAPRVLRHASRRLQSDEELVQLEIDARMRLFEEQRITKYNKELASARKSATKELFEDTEWLGTQEFEPNALRRLKADEELIESSKEVYE